MHVYFDKAFSKRFSEILVAEYDRPETADKLWEQIYIDHIKELDICLLYTSLYEPHVGGVETYTKGIANALVKKGHRVIVVTNNTDNALEQESAKGIEIVRLPCSPLLNGRFPL